MLLGLRTVVYYVKDLAGARDWYARVFGIAPYFDTPYYVGFNVGGYELGLHPTEGGQHAMGPGGSEAYWGVDSIETALAQVTKLGAKLVRKAEDVGEGIKVAAVADPDGNVIGLIENPTFALPPNAGD